MPSSTYIGRLAPSPTGLLHLGHARTFWTAFTRAQSAGGQLWLRDEDLDPQRSRPGFSAAMKDDLRWLGIHWHAEIRQSDRLPLYRAALDRLLALGLAYPCTCSRKDLQTTAQAPHEDDDEPIYTGRCRSATGRCRPAPHESATILGAPCLASETWEEPPQLFTQATSYRFRVPDGDLITFADLHAGPQSYRAGCDPTADFGDFLIWRKSLSQAPGDIGLPSYQLACVVDDAAMNITEVVRGRDLLKSTARQLLLQRALALPTPQYFHCDLMRDAAGLRLAKRHDAQSLRAFRDQGLSPSDVRALF